MSVEEYYNLGKKLFPICRSITGKGTKKTLHIIKKKLKDLKIRSVSSGTKAFDWKVPPEWNIKDAFVIDKEKKKIIDFKKNNLHVVNYSVPVNKKISKKNLLNRLHSLPNQKKAIPYITSYYKRYWGFCVSDEFKKNFQKVYKNKDKFKTVVKSNLNSKGNLNYGEYLIKGKSKKEILISTYICHPSMANNELSGPIISMLLIDYFKKKKNKMTLRFLFIPETIGSIVYLSKNLNYLQKYVISGYNLSCLGDQRQYSAMFSKYKNSPSDKALTQAFKELKIRFKEYSFLSRGSDERQYNSPKVNLDITSVFRSKYGEYPEYHTSLDDFSLVTKKGIKGSFELLKRSISILLKQKIPMVKYKCEPQMGKRNLYPNLSTKKTSRFTNSLMDFLQYSDGRTNLKEISKKIKVNYAATEKIYKLLIKKGVIY